MGKRASGSKGTASPEKVPRIEKMAAQADPLLVLCQPMFKVIRASCSGDAEVSSAEMLCAALPFALRQPEHAEKRHEFQERILDAVASQLSNAVAEHKDAILAAETEEANLEADKAQSIAVHEGIVSRLAEKVEVRDKAEQAHKEQQSILDDAVVGLEAAKKSVEVAEGERQSLQETREDFEAGITDLWSPLKASELQGKQWRERERLLVKLSDKLRDMGVEQSLQTALLVALKINVTLRGEFAQSTVSYAEEAYLKHIASLKERIENFGEEVSARTAAVAKAGAKVAAAQEAVDVACEASIVAQNAWVDETTVESEHRAKTMTFAPTAEKITLKLSSAKAALDQHQEVFDSFMRLRTVDRPTAVEESHTAG